MPAPDLNVLLNAKYNKIDGLSKDILVAMQQLQKSIAQGANINQETQKYSNFLSNAVKTISLLYWQAILAIKTSDQLSAQEKRRQIFIRGGAVMYWQLYEKIVTNAVNELDPSIIAIQNLSLRFVRETSKPEWSDAFSENCEKIFLHLADKLDGARLLEILNEIIVVPVEPAKEPEPETAQESEPDTSQEPEPDNANVAMLQDEPTQEPESDTANVAVLQEEPKELSNADQIVPEPDNANITMLQQEPTQEPELDTANITTVLQEESTQEPEPDNSNNLVLPDEPTQNNDKPTAAEEDDSVAPMPTVAPKKKPKKKKPAKQELPLAPLEKLKTALSFQTEAGYSEAIKLLNDNVNDAAFIQESDQTILSHVKTEADSNKPSVALINFIKEIRLGYEFIKYATVNEATRLSAKIREIAFSQICDLDDSDFYKMLKKDNIAKIIEQAKNKSASSSQRAFYTGIQKSFEKHCEYIKSNWGVKQINQALEYLFNNNFKFTDNDGMCSLTLLKLLAGQQNERGETPLMRCIQRAQHEPKDSKIFNIIEALILYSDDNDDNLAADTFEESKNVLHYWSEHFNPAASLRYIFALWASYQVSLGKRGKLDYLSSIGGAEDVNGRNFIHTLIAGLSDEKHALQVFNTFENFSSGIYVASLIKDKNGANIYTLLDAKPNYWPKFNEILNNNIPANLFKFMQMLHSKPLCHVNGALSPPPFLRSVRSKISFDSMYSRLEKIPVKSASADKIKAMLNDYYSIRVKVKELYGNVSKMSVNDSVLEFFNIVVVAQLDSPIEQSYVWHKMVHGFLLNEDVLLAPEQLQELKALLKNVHPNAVFWHAFQTRKLSVIQFIFRDCKIPLTFDIAHSAILETNFEDPINKQIVFYVHESFKDHPEFSRLSSCSFMLFEKALESLDTVKIQVLKELGFDPLARNKGLSVLGTHMTKEFDRIASSRGDEDTRRKVAALFPEGVPEAEIQHLREIAKDNFQLRLDSSQPKQRSQVAASVRRPIM